MVFDSLARIASNGTAPARPGAVPGRIIGGHELPTSAAAARPGAVQSRIIGGRKLPTSTRMARRVQLATLAAAARPGANRGRIIGGRELPTSPLTTDSDGPPGAAGNPGGRGPPGCYPGSHNWRARAANLATDD